METTQTNVLERTVRIAARPETVFAFLTETEKITRWMGLNAKLEPQPGGIYRVDINGRDIMRGEFLEVVANRRVVFTFGWEAEGSPLPSGASTVEISLTPDGEDTLVHLRHLNLPADQHHGHAEGWEHYLERLTSIAQGHDPGADPWAGADGMAASTVE